MHVLSKPYNLVVELGATNGATRRRYFVAVADARLKYRERYFRIFLAAGLVPEFEEGQHTSVVRVSDER